MRIRPLTAAWLLVLCACEGGRVDLPAADVSSGERQVPDLQASFDVGPDAPVAPSWQRFASPATDDLNDVHGTTAEDVWLTGSTVLHFDGQRWTISDPQAAWKVWAVTPTDVWTTSGDGASLRRFDGSAWQTLENPVTGVGFWTNIWGRSPGELWIIGATLGASVSSALVRFDGSLWDPLPVEGLAEALTGASASVLWAVGQTSAKRRQIWRFDGVAWQGVDAGDGEPLHGVWAASSQDAWAVGQHTILRFDGVSWHDTTPAFLGQGWLVDIWGSSPSSIWAVGYVSRDLARNTFGQGLIVHFNGTRWAPVTAPGVIDASTGALFGVWGFGRDNVWAVGAAGTILRLR